MKLRPLVFACLAMFALPVQVTYAQRAFPSIYREQRGIEVRDPSQLPRYRVYDVPTPETVAKPQADLEERPLSLDEAIRISMQNMDVVRVLSGTTATNSGRTIYDPAVTNTTIDEQQAAFDPQLSSSNTWNRLENPAAIFDPVTPGESLITGVRTDGFNSSTGLNKLNAFGGTTEFGVQTNPFRVQPGTFPLNPQRDTATFLQYTQPLLQGGRVGANLAPIVIARINTERSFFQMKDSVQENMRGVIEGYWNLVAARTDAWARRQQVQQLTETVRQIQAGVNSGRLNAADLAQSELSLANFRANLITAEANVIQREAALRNILGLPPADGARLVPNTPPIREPYNGDWEMVLEMAGERRPDIIELKLILEADQQQLLLSRNTALPRVDAVGLYRWNGLDGVMPNGNPLTSESGAYTDWTTGVNFSVPLGLRQSRAALRRQELVLMRDRANLNQGLHAAAHSLATSLRALDQLYEQYLAFREARRAARINLEKQLSTYRTGQAILINVLQAVTDWGNAVASEAGSLTQFNTQLATIERQTGTILETHGVFFFEERFASISPKGRLFRDAYYARDMRPSENGKNYEDTEKPAEEAFDLTPPPNLRDLPDLKYEDIELPKIEEELRQLDELIKRRKLDQLERNQEPKPEGTEEEPESLPKPLSEEGPKPEGTSTKRKRSRMTALFER